MLSHVSGRQTEPGSDHRSQAFDVAGVHNTGRNVSDRFVNNIGGQGHNYLRRVHAFVHNAVVIQITI